MHMRGWLAAADIAIAARFLLMVCRASRRLSMSIALGMVALAVGAVEAAAEANAAAAAARPAVVRCVVTTDCHCPADGVTKATSCLRQCISECHNRAVSGGAQAVVHFPRGKFLTGALNLTSGMKLQLDAGSELLGSLDAVDYPLVPALPSYGITRDGGVPAADQLVRHQALLSGWNTTGLSIIGEGTINGQGHVLGPDGKSWYTRKKQYGRPRLVEPMFCTDFKIEGVQLQNSAFWTLHPYACDGVVIRNLNITARGHPAPNSDGIDPDSSRNVLVEGCFVDVGDDTVAIKSGIDYAGRQFAHPSENIVFRDCHFVQNAMAIGSEQSGGVRNVTFENIIMGPRHAPYTEGPLIHLKSQRGRGGYIKDVRVALPAPLVHAHLIHTV
eukprot:SAG31_NODE_938_length_10882_cov_18.550032_5_plen_386_part_00